ncbi:unnamed protein product [Bursaphelenchus okinawaensis]|uniref:Uncharacterized protein n=1 Tax=Bursaphelenchus okinawaensis TaxID=465554 RepID=A0A811KCW6_9BILA|nr:unnamed protein product [Bursaphelenchus okinawaensis]CAG9099454.1 unnamed protein product [Bursaphelenchus okinawaensis]
MDRETNSSFLKVEDMSGEIISTTMLYPSYVFFDGIVIPKLQPQIKTPCGFVARSYGNFTQFDVQITQNQPVESFMIEMTIQDQPLNYPRNVTIDPADDPSVIDDVTNRTYNPLNAFEEYNQYWWPVALLFGLIGGIFLGSGVLLLGLYCYLHYPTPDRDPEVILFGPKPPKKPKELSESIRETIEEKLESAKKRKDNLKQRKKDK